MFAGFNVPCQTKRGGCPPRWYGQPVTASPQSDNAFEREIVGIGLDLDLARLGLFDIGDQLVLGGKGLGFFKGIEIHADLATGIG